MQYQLVLQFPLAEDFDFDALIELETKLTFELGSEHEVDGHDIGSGEINIFIHTNNPENAFEKTTHLLSKKLYSALKAAYRDIDSYEYTWIYPADCTEEFKVV